MRRLIVFNHISLDGFIADANGDMSFAHRSDPEFEAFTAENAKGKGDLVFGRVTYEMMMKFWPTPAAAAAMPTVAKKMNEARKYVFSRTLKKADWNNTTLLSGDPAEAIRKLKAEPGEG